MKDKLSITLSVFTVLIILFYIAFTFGNTLIRAGITGYQVMSTRLVIISREEIACNMTLEPGWNLVSFPCISDDIDKDILLNPLNRSYDSIKTYFPTDLNDPWKSYNPNLPNWTIQDLSLLTRRDGYWIYVPNETELYLNNSLATPTLIDVYPGWNLLGYPSRTPRHLNETFDQLIPNFDYIYMYNATDMTDPWKEYTWNSSLPSNQDLNYTSMYYGYWVYMLNTDTLVIN